MNRMIDLPDTARVSRRAVVGTLGMAGVAGAGWGAAPALAAAAAAQGAPASTMMAHPGTIRVVGRAALPLQPDAAVVTLGVDLSAPALADAQAETAAAMDAVLAALGDLSIQESAIQTSSLNVYPVRAYDPQTGVPGDVSAFQVTHLITVSIRGAQEVGAVLAAAIDAGANVVYGVTFFTEDVEEVEAKARGLAVAHAREKALQLADAAGLSLGQVTAIGEANTTVGTLYDSAFVGGQGAGDASVAPGTNTVTASIEVAFAFGN